MMESWENLLSCKDKNAPVKYTNEKKNSVVALMEKVNRSSDKFAFKDFIFVYFAAESSI